MTRRYTAYDDDAYRILRPAILLRDKRTCRYCHHPGGTIDHIIPTSRGGNHHTDNMVTACEPCNTNKDNHTLTEWINTGNAPEGAKTLATQRKQAGLPC
jgi:5-methylcytosine-specific restriction endonuclease McrA